MSTHLQYTSRQTSNLSAIMESRSPLHKAKQLLIVLSPSWTSPHAHLLRIARQHTNAAWRPCGELIAVTLGRNGLAWGRSPIFTVNGLERRKTEGDQCGPAGIFAISKLFGDALPDSPHCQAFKLPYLATNQALKCIDDPKSRFYNQIVAASEIAQADWQSHEEMLRNDHRYELGAVIEHNPDATPAAGSCVFLHVWDKPGIPTAGCTAMSLADIQTIATWLDAEAHPLLVQLPCASYAEYQTHWQLPTLTAFDNLPTLP